VGDLPEPLRVAIERIVREFHSQGRITHSQLKNMVALDAFASAYLEAAFELLAEEGIKVVPDDPRP
jgi:hypothetical protein